MDVRARRSGDVENLNGIGRRVRLPYALRARLALVLLAAMLLPPASSRARAQGASEPLPTPDAVDTSALATPDPADGTVTPAPAAESVSAPTVESADAPEASPAPTPFTIVWFPDTQSSAYGEPEALAAMGNWVAEHGESDDVVYVLQTGDLVDNGFVERQWENFELAYDPFAGKTPYFCIAGNHDKGVKRREWDGYLARPYAHTVPPEQEHLGGKAAYTLFTAGGVDFLVVGIGDGAEAESLFWAREIFNRYPERYGILLLHAYLHGTGTFVEENAWLMYYRLVRRCPNVRMTLSGHYRGTAYRAFALDDDSDGLSDRTVHSLLCNYQNYLRLGGQLRLLQFDPAANSLTVKTFSALTGHPMRDDTMKADTFTLEGIF